MKIKIDHVTNSSSASFMVPKSALTNNQVMMIRDHIETAALLMQQHPDDPHYKFGYVSENYKWFIEESDHSISGSTSMDNFDMFAFLISIGVNNNEIHSKGSNY